MRQDDKAFKDLTEKTTDNGWIIFKKEAKVSHNNFFKNYATSLGLDKDYDFKPLRDETDSFKKRHQRFQLHYKNIPVEGVEFTLHSQDDVLELGHGKIPEGLSNDISKPMPESKALDLALANMKVTLDDLKKLGRSRPEGTLLLARVSNETVKMNFRLCYAFDIRGSETLNAFKVYVNAATGEIVKKISLIHSCGLTKSSNSLVKSSPARLSYSPPPPTFKPNYLRYYDVEGGVLFVTEQNPANPNQNRLSAFNNALNTKMSVGGNTDWASLPDVTNDIGNNTDDDDWCGNNSSRNAQTAHWLTQRMYQFMSQSPISRNGINGQGLYPRVVTDYPYFGSLWNQIDRIQFGISSN